MRCWRRTTGGVVFVNILVATARNITLLRLNTESADNMYKAQISVRGRYMATAFLLSSDRRRYGDLILSLKTNYTKQ